MNRLLVASLRRPILTELNLNLKRTFLTMAGAHRSQLLSLRNNGQGVLASGLFLDTTQKRLNSTGSVVSESPLIHLAESLLVNIHDQGLFEWSTTFFLVSLLFRFTVCIPLKIYQEHLIARRVILSPKIQEVVDKSFREKKLDPRMLTMDQRKKLANQASYIRDYMYRKEAAQPLKVPLASLLQFFPWIHISLALRGLATGNTLNNLQVTEQIANSSFLWIDNLAAADPYYILPAVYLISSLTNFKYASLSVDSTDLRAQGLFFKIKKGLAITVPVVVSLIMVNMPSCIALFWLSSNAFYFVEQLAIDSIRVRRLVRIPKTQVEPASIYMQKFNNLKKEFAWIKRFKKP